MQLFTNSRNKGFYNENLCLYLSTHSNKQNVCPNGTIRFSEKFL